MDLKTSDAKGDILIVDDNPANLRTLLTILTGKGYEVRVASNGETALNMVSANAPDLILLDIHMPSMDGYQVCQRLKDGAQTRDIPVIFMCAPDGMHDKVRGFNLGGEDYITRLGRLLIKSQ